MPNENKYQPDINQLDVRKCAECRVLILNLIENIVLLVTGGSSSSLYITNY